MGAGRPPAWREATALHVRRARLGPMANTKYVTSWIADRVCCPRKSHVWWCHRPELHECCVCAPPNPVFPLSADEREAVGTWRVNLLCAVLGVAGLVVATAAVPTGKQDLGYICTPAHMCARTWSS